MDPIVVDSDTADGCPDAVVTHHDLFVDADEEIDREKWIKAEKAGHDLAVDEIKRQWVREHWHGFVRSRLFEHLHGRRFWKHFDHEDFGLLNRGFRDDQVLLDRIVDRFKAGQENLNVITWAHDFHLPLERVHNILLAININRCRIYHEFE
jgi:hypothetical protein